MAKPTLKSCEQRLNKSGLLRKVVRRSKRFIDVAFEGFYSEISGILHYPAEIQVRGSWREDGNRAKNPEAIIYRVRIA